MDLSKKNFMVSCNLVILVFLIVLVSSNCYVSNVYAFFHTKKINQDKEGKTIKMDSPKGIWYNLGRFYADEGNSTGAIAAFDRALSLDPDFIEALNSKAYVLRDIGNYSQAIDVFNKVIEKDSQHKWAWNGIGYCLVQLGNFTESLKYIDKALQIDPGYKSALENKANVLMKIGKIDEAQRTFEDILSKYPDNQFAQTSLQSLKGNLSIK